MLSFRFSETDLRINWSTVVKTEWNTQTNSYLIWEKSDILKLIHPNMVHTFLVVKSYCFKFSDIQYIAPDNFLQFYHCFLSRISAACFSRIGTTAFLLSFSIFQLIWAYLKDGFCHLMSLQSLQDFLFIRKFNNIHSVFH